MKKRQSLIYILLISVFVGTTIFAVYNYKSTKAFVLDSVERETDELLKNFTVEVNRFSLDRIAEVQLMADHIPYLMEKGEDVTLFLHNQNEIMPYYTGLGFITPEGIVNAADGSRFPVQQRESFERALTGEIMFSDVYALNQDQNQKVTAISVPVVNFYGTIVGVVSGVVNLSDVISALAKESSLPGLVYLLKDKEVLFTSRKSLLFENVIPNSEQFLQVIDEKEIGNWTDEQQPNRFIKYEHTWNDWVVVVDSSINPDTDAIAVTFWRSVILVLGALIVISNICYYLLKLQRRDKMRSQTDLLTGLGNRVALANNLGTPLQQEPEKLITLFFIKLDRLSDINERFGYQIGDQMLFAISRKLEGLPGKLNAYRVGNNEFVVKTFLATTEEQQAYAASIIKVIEQPVHVGQSEVISVTASVGIRASVADDQFEPLMQDAMFASHEASKKGGNQYVYFTAQLAKESNRNRHFASELDKALDNGEFYLVYQPIYSIELDHIVSFETLLRWKSPVFGEVGPVDFIPLLEESGAIVEVGRWIIEEVALQVIKWEQTGYENFTVTLNVSVEQLQYEHFLKDVKQILKKTNVKTERLIFEVTESVVADNIEEATEILQILNFLGIKTALDDFGTGYSSLSILKILPFQYMKIDRAFIIEALNDNGESRAILTGIIEIASGLNLTTITEGVETLEQLLLLKELGAHRIQGYYFSRPVLPEVAIEFLNKENLLETMVHS